MVVRAADSLLRRGVCTRPQGVPLRSEATADRQAGNRRLHDQVDYRGFGESGPCEGSLSTVGPAKVDSS
jgi:hypothetical protein